MSRIVFIATVVIAVYYGYRFIFKPEADRVAARRARRKREAATGSVGTLVKDPKSGDYYPAKD